MSSSVLSTAPVVVEDGEMSSPRADGPSRRRSFTPAQKLKHLAEYEAACESGQGGAYLRREGLYSSLVCEWRRLRDAGLLEGKEPGAKVGRPSAEQAEIAGLRRELAESERKLATTQTALEIMGKAHALLEQIKISPDRCLTPTGLTHLDKFRFGSAAAGSCVYSSRLWLSFLVLVCGMVCRFWWLWRWL